MDYIALGQVITDDIVYPNGKLVRNQLGGIAYTLAGMRIWSERVGLCGGLGTDFEKLHGAWFSENRIDLLGTRRGPLPGPHSLVRYFPDGEREERPLPGCMPLEAVMPLPSEIPGEYHPGCKGLYLYQDVEKAYWEELLEYLGKHPAVSVWEIHGKTAVHEQYERIRECLKQVTIFSLNRTEGFRLFQSGDPLDIVGKLLDDGARAVLFRMGEDGALVGDSGGIWHVPAAETRVVDVTGGGNSSTGAFLVGYCESGGDIVEAGKCAAAASSLVIQQYGPPARIDADLAAEAVRRKAALQVRKIK